MKSIKIGRGFKFGLYPGIMLGVMTDDTDMPIDENISGFVRSHLLYLPFFRFGVDTFYMYVTAEEGELLQKMEDDGDFE